MPTARTPRPSARARATTPALPALLACPLCKGEHLVTPACAVDDRTGAALPLREAIETAHFRDAVLARSAEPFRCGGAR